jgi:hypothetical protein
MEFSMGTVDQKNITNTIDHIVSYPALWCDLDGCKDLDIPGEEYYAELRNSEAELVSAFSRSSRNGIQMFWKLDELVTINGDVEQFKSKIAGLLYDIAYYYGGDSQVVTANRLMRLPGALNLKPKYKDDPFIAKAKISDRVFSLKELKNRYRPDAERVPLFIGYAITRALSDVWNKGERHKIILQLCGSVRKHGINKEACLNLCKHVLKYFGDPADRSKDVETTYVQELDSVATLHADYQQIATAIERAIDLWFKLKVAYCKHRNITFVPEIVNLLNSTPTAGSFYEREYKTYFLDSKNNEVEFANFIIKLKGRIIKEDGSTAWLAEIYLDGNEFPVPIEISTDKHSQWQKFLTVPNVPVGATVKVTKMWPEYIGWLQTTCPAYIVKESTYYGWLNVNTEKPILLMPGDPHDGYVWTGKEDTALAPRILQQDILFDEAQAYLKKFIECYATYHEPTFIWPALGWFASCVAKQLIYQHYEGFPILVIQGLSQSGKSHLIEHVLSRHYGCQGPHDFATTSIVAIRTWLSSNNICPMIIDEFRHYEGSKEPKANEMIHMIRALHDRFQSSRGTANSSSGGLNKSIFQTPLCLTGEHGFTDSASLSRTITIPINRNWINEYRLLPDEERKILDERRMWLHDSKHQGWLGSILLKWVVENYATTEDLIKQAKDIAFDTCPTKEGRKCKCCATDIFGHKLMGSLYRNYNLNYPLKKSEMLNYLYTCDPTILSGQSDTDTIRYLFELTDSIIIDAHRARMPHENSLYCFDIEDPSYMYLDVNRWYRLLRPQVKAMESATLSEKNAFVALLHDQVGRDKSPFVTFVEAHPVLGKCVKIDLKQVQATYGVNVTQWKGIVDFDTI